MKTALKTPIARLLAAVLIGLAAQPAAAGTVTISPTPLATAGGGSVLPNLLFVLDSSGSMDSDYLPDYVNDNNKCMVRSGGNTACTTGDAPWNVGGANGFNGVAYSPMTNYKPGLKSDSTTVVANPLTVTAVQNDAYGVQAGGTTNVTTGVQDLRYCNSNNICKRNGADNAGATLISGTDYLGNPLSAGRFPYRTTNTNSSTTIFGLPEMMTLALFSRSGSTVTATLAGSVTTLAVNDWIYVTGPAGIATNAAQVTAVTITVSPPSISFTYTSGSSGTIAATSGSFRKHSAGTVARVAGSTTVTVTSAAHGLVTNDIILINSPSGSPAGADSNRNVTAVDANTFTYTQTGGTTTVINAAPAATWARTGLYNVRGTVNGTAMSYYITPIEWCSDINLTQCVEAIPPATPPAGFTFPAYVRFCQTQEQALAPGAVSDSSGTPRCRSKFVGSGTTQWIYPRFGWFNRDIIQASTATYARSAARTDCAAAPSCTYAEEIQNYARWWAYYRTRMQMMKTASGRAFLPFISNPSATPAIPNKLRVGFITINPFYAIGGSTDQGTVQTNRYLKISDFNTTQAASWYTMFYLQDPAQSTPLREALSRAGWIYSGKLNTGLTSGIPVADDPMQASCQRNFTLLTTDGYWNGNAGQNLQGGAIGNLDNANPTIDSPYTTAAVDRTSTGTFDGGKGTVVTTITPTTQLEQVVCLAGNNTTFNGGTQQACGCAAGNHRTKQRTTTSTQTISLTDGVQTANSTVTTYAFTNITGCTPALIVNNQTPANRLQQALCTAGATINFGQGATVACGCPANLTRVKQQTGDRTHTVITTDGAVTTDSYNAYTYSTQDITACDAKIDTATTITTNRQQVLCQGNAATAYSSPGAGWPNTQAACGCAAGLPYKQIAQRTVTRTLTVLTVDGVGQAPSTVYNTTFDAPPVACNATVSTTQRNPVTVTETKVCSGASTITFADGPTPTTDTCSCSTSGGGSPRKQLIRMTRTGVQYITAQTIDGVAQTVPQYNGGALLLEYSVTNGVAPWVTTKFSGGGCASSGSTQNAVAQSITGAGSATSSTGTTITAGMAAAPVVTGPTTTTTSTGTTVTAANFTIVSPQINDPAGATTTVTTGTAAVIGLVPNPSVPAVGAPTTTTVAGGYPNTLADVAMYYYRSDLRGGTDPFGNTTGPAMNLGGSGTTDVSVNNVPAKSGAKDFVTHQHMVTFAVGLADGLMRYQADYELAASGDFKSIKDGTSNGCFWVSGTCDWPQPIADDASALDDLWHAAVNGRGQFYLALNADSLSLGIQTALTAVNAQVAAAAASATSSPNVTQTDNQIFSTTYETNTWSGKVFAQTIDPATGNVDPVIQWQADGQLLAKVAAASDTRVIWTFDGAVGNTNLLKPFTWASLSAAEQAFFLNKCVPASTMTQCAGLNAANLLIANDGASLVGYLRGWQGNEVAVFRDRTYIDVANNNAVVQTVLGDTISAKPAYLRRPQFNYADAVTPAYSSFLSANTSRSPRVYVAANDGYLHAFHGDTGEEMWAYLPRFLMPGLYQLADSGYATLHRYFADGSPETGEVFDTTASAWKSILIAGVAGGGRGYYALDITDPASPKGLWEFCSDATLCAISDPDLGLSYGNAVIGKRALDGRWIVLIASGLNNIGPGTGVGYFYVLDAITGAILDKVATTAGDLATPSGLMKISAFYDSALTDATFQYAYAGDQLGNVWRIDVRTSPPTVLHIATLTDGSTPPRGAPITTRPSLTRISGNRVLYFGSGRYLGTPDLSDPGAASGISWQQTLWAFKDKDSDYGNLRTDTNLVQQVLSQLTPTDRGISTNPVNWNTQDGWFVDFNPSFAGVPNSPGEGVNLVDPRLVLGTLVVTTNVPAAGGSSCSVGGSSFEYNFDFKTGSAVSTSAGGVVGRSLGGTITVGVAIVQLPSGAIKSISTGADTSKTTTSVNTSATGAAVRRFSYRIR